MNEFNANHFKSIEGCTCPLEILAEAKEQLAYLLAGGDIPHWITQEKAIEMVRAEIDHMESAITKATGRQP